ncbi:hypothetical protein ABT063_38400 [Streptomyces sp. NPDC002838]
MTALAAATLAAGALATTATAAPAAPNDGDPTLTHVYIWASDVQLREHSA